MQHTRRFSSDVIAVSLLVLSVVFCFRQVIASGGQLFGSDFILQFWPWKRFIYDGVWSQAAVPFWNPHVLSGTPFIANIQASPFYPLGFLYYLIPPEFAYGYSTILHCLLGSCFMYIFIRDMKVSPWGAFLAAFIFTFNGYFMTHLYAGHLSFVQNYIWIPLIFLFLFRFMHTVQFKWAIFAGLTLGVQILGGFPQIAFYTILAVLAFGLFHTAMAFKQKVIANAKHIGIGVFVTLAIGFGLAAVQLLPTLELTRLSGRSGGVPYWFAVSESLHPLQWISLLIPDFFGNPLDNTYLLDPKTWHFWETCGYVGVFGVGLLFVPAPKERTLRQTRLFFTALVVMSLFLALGEYNPIYPLIYKLPGFGSFRIPAQILFLFVFSMSILAATAYHQLGQCSSEPPKSLILFFMIAGVGAVFLFFSGDFIDRILRLFFNAVGGQPAPDAAITKVSEKTHSAITRFALLSLLGLVLFVCARKAEARQTFFKVILLALVILDVGLYAAPFVRPYPYVFPEVKKAITHDLKKESGLGRVAVTGNLFGNNDPILYYFQAINGYDPLVLGRYIMYLQASQNLPLVKEVLVTDFLRRYDHKFLRMLHLTHILGDKGITRIAATLPRAFLVNRAVIKPEAEILDFMQSDDFDPGKVVVLEPGDGSFLWPQTPTESLEGSCTITEYGYETIKMRCSSNQPCYLVMSEMYYPGWEATVGGKAAPVLRGNYLFRVIPLGKGDHVVETRFISRPFRIGAAVSFMTLISCASAIVVMHRRSRLNIGRVK